MEQNKNQNKDGTQKKVALPESAIQQMAENMNQTVLGKQKKGALLIIATQPPVGDNTTLMLYMVKMTAVDNNIPAAIFTPNMANTQTVNRLVAITTGIGYEKIAAGTLEMEDWKTLDENLPLIVNAPLYVDDTQVQTMAELQSKITDLVTAHGVRLVVIDHLDEICADGLVFDDERARLDYLSRSLKALAEELTITIIAVEK